jgi:hypothetical protein
MKYKVSTRSNNKQKYTDKSINSGLITVSEYQFDKVKPTDGKLYKAIFPLDAGTVIGEADGSYLRSSIPHTNHHGFLEEIDIESVKIKVTNTDGKQTGKETLSENIGKFYDLEEIGDHDKYKYIITIDGKQIALSADNCVFYDSDMIGQRQSSIVGNIIKYYGALLECTGTYDNGHINYYKGRCIYTGNYIYVSINKPTVIDDIVTVTSSESTIEYLRNKGVIHGQPKRNRIEIAGYTQIDTKTGSSLVFPNPQGYTLLSKGLIMEPDVEKFKELIKGKYILSNEGVLYVNPKLKNELKEYCYFPDNQPRRGRGRINFRNL